MDVLPSNLDELRSQIDAVDQDLLALLNKRAGLSLKIGEIKKHSGTAIRQPEREKEIIRRLVETGPGPLLQEHIQEVYQAIFAVSRAMQQFGADKNRE
jgi:chorismate mutase/prephenate dehydratase